MPQAALVFMVKTGISLGLSKGLAIAVSSFILKTTAFLGINAIAKKLSKRPSEGGQRQTLAHTVQLGEVARQFVFGRCVTAGSLMDAGDFGGEHGTDWNVFVLALADHPIDALEGFWAWGEYFPFSGNGMQSGFSNGLDMEFQNATAAGTAPPARFASAVGWGATDVAAGVSKIWVAYNVKTVEDRGSRPEFRFQVRGAKIYIARKDSTQGGSGSHRWNNPATWEWTENPIDIRNNWVWGIFSGGLTGQPEHLWIGRGLTFDEHPPSRSFAAANLCDEDVPLKAGGTEKRYRVSGVINADDAYDRVERLFEDATAGVLVQREGGLELEPGAAKAVVGEITDGDLVTAPGAVHEIEDFLPDPERINTVQTLYMAPDQKWAMHSAPVRRSLTAIAEDGGPIELPLSLELVTSGTQAQRVAEIRRRQARHERSRVYVLPPRLSMYEEGDWLGVTSDRYQGGSRVVYRVEAWDRTAEWRRVLVLREISADDYAWTAATDEITPGAAPPPEPSPPGALTLSGVTFQGISKNGVPGLRASWSTPVDPAVLAVRLEIRELGQAQVTPTATPDVAAGMMETTSGVPSAASIQARLVPVVPQHRTATPTAWVTLTSSVLAAGTAVAILGPDGQPITGGDILKPRPYAADQIRNTFPSLTGLTASNATIAATGSGDNALSFTPTGASPYLQWALGRPGDKVHRIRARIRAVGAPITEAMWDGRLTYNITGSNHSLSAGRVATIPFPAGGLPVGEWRDVEWVCDDLIDYLDAANIISVRLRPVTGAAGVLHIGRLEAGYAGGATEGAVLGRDLVKADGNVPAPSEIITADGPSAGVIGGGALLWKDQADWAADVASKPVELTDGRIGAGLDGLGRATGLAVPDTRDDNPAPSHYRGRGRGVYQEFKRGTTVGLPGAAVYVTVSTKVQWTNASGGVIVQTAEGDDGVWKRRGSADDTSWSAWEKSYDQQNRPAFGAGDLLESGSTPATNANYKTALGPSSGVIGGGALLWKDQADWLADVSFKPTELTDGRIGAGLTPEGKATIVNVDTGQGTATDSPPSYYRARGYSSVVEQKASGPLGLPTNVWGGLQTFVVSPSTSVPVRQTYFTNDGVWKRRSASESAWGAWEKSYDQQNRPAFGSSDLLESGSTVATNANYKTALGPSSGVIGAGGLLWQDTVGAGDIDADAVQQTHVAEGTFTRASVAFTAGQINWVTNDNEQQVQELLDVEVLRGEVLITASINLSVETNTGNAFKGALKLYRNGVELPDARSEVWSSITNIAGSFTYQGAPRQVTIAFLDTPPPGTHDYSVGYAPRIAGTATGVGGYGERRSLTAVVLEG